MGRIIRTSYFDSLAPAAGSAAPLAEAISNVAQGAANHGTLSGLQRSAVRSAATIPNRPTSKPSFSRTLFGCFGSTSTQVPSNSETYRPKGKGENTRSRATLSLDDLDNLLVADIEFNGTGHVVWGNKPVLLITDESVFPALSKIEREQGLKPNFLLCAGMDEGYMEKGYMEKGFLVNRDNLEKLVGQHHDYLAARLCAEPLVDSAGGPTGSSAPIPSPVSNAELADRAIEFLKTYKKGSDEEMLGVLLGYGIDNSKKFSQILDWVSVYTTLTSDPAAKFAMEVNGRVENLPSQSHLLAIPPFRSWPGVESDRLIEQYLNDSIDIKEVTLKDALASPEPAKAVAAAFRNAIFKETATP